MYLCLKVVLLRVEIGTLESQKVDLLVNNRGQLKYLGWRWKHCNNRNIISVRFTFQNGQPFVSYSISHNRILYTGYFGNSQTFFRIYCIQSSHSYLSGSTHFLQMVSTYLETFILLTLIYDGKNLKVFKSSGGFLIIICLIIG